MLRWLPLLIALGASITYAFAVGDPPVIEGQPAFQVPELARIIFFHLPSAWISSVLILFCSYCGLRYLMKGEWEWDRRLTASAEVGLLFGIFTILTGMVFSEVQWGIYWNWDARQTSYLMVLVLFAAVLALRAAFPDARRRASVGATYAAALAIPALFLIWVYPRMPGVTSLHPSQDSLEGVRELFDTAFRIGIYGNLATFGFVAWLTYRLRVRLLTAESELEERYGYDDADRGGAAADHTARPVDVSR